MPLFKLFEDVGNAIVKTVKTAVSIPTDIVTFGGEFSEKKEPSTYTEDAVDELGDALSDLLDI